MTKYEKILAHNTALAIYSNASSAEKLINASPLKFELEVGKSGSISLEPNAPTTNMVDGAEKQRGLSAPEEAQHHDDHNDIDDELDPNSSGDSRLTKKLSGTTAFQGLGGSDKWSAVGKPIKENPLESVPTPSQPRPFTPNSLPLYSPSAPADLPVPSPHQAHSFPTEPEFRAFCLKISRSLLDHQAYIERQGYYGRFNVDKMSMMAEDLQDRVPLEGMMDCQLRKPEVPLWVRDMKKDKVTRSRPSLRQMWEEGRREREEVQVKAKDK